MTRNQWYTAYSQKRASVLWQQSVACVWYFAQYVINDANASSLKKSWALGALGIGEEIADAIWPILLVDATISGAADPDTIADATVQTATENAIAQIYAGSW